MVVCITFPLLHLPLSLTHPRACKPYFAASNYRKCQVKDTAGMLQYDNNLICVIGLVTFIIQR